MQPEPTVFVVDDDPAIVKAIRELVQVLGLKVESYSSADAFLLAYQADRPACLVLDVRMPGLSGLELQKHLKQNGKQLPIIMISGHGDVRMAVEAMKEGAIDFMEKPFRAQELCDNIQTAIRSERENWQRRQQRQKAQQRISTLTPAEHTVMDLVIAGKTNKMIARQLGLSVRAIEDRRARMMRKLQVNSWSELLELAAARGPA
jgi:FixJ family two-component response regulator